MAICPRCRHDDEDKKVSSRICKVCLRALVLGTQPNRLVSLTKGSSETR